MTDDAAAKKANDLLDTWTLGLSEEPFQAIADLTDPLEKDIAQAIRDAVADARRDAAEMVRETLLSGAPDKWPDEIEEVAARIAGAAPAAKEDGDGN